MKTRPQTAGAFLVAIIFLLGLSLGVHKLASPSPDLYGASSIEEFKALQTQYFRMLDLRAPHDQLRGLPEFADRLSRIAAQARLELAQERFSTPDQKAEVGLVFIYDALMTHNNTHAALEGILSLDNLREARRFSVDSGNDRDEFLAREQYAQSALMSALTLRPDDRRIDSWLAAVRALIERIQIGKVLDASLAPVIDTIKERPTFNLWTALLMFQGRDASTDLFARLVDEAKIFIRSDNPCIELPQDCQNGVHAPHNFQTSVTVMGDAFLRKANDLLASGNIAGAMELAHFAQGTYDELISPDHLEHTNTWPDRVALSVRRDAVASLLKGQTIDDAAFVSSDDFKRPYECSACHGRAEM